MININISLSDVDYEAALDALLPIFMEYLSKKSDNPFLTTILTKTKSISTAAAKGALKALPQGTRDELAVVCLNHYKNDIIHILTETSRQKGIIMELNDIAISIQE